MNTPSVRVLIQCQDCDQNLIEKDGITPSGAYIVPACACWGHGEQGRNPERQEEHREPAPLPKRDTVEQMRHVAKFVLDHGGLLWQALAGHADTLNEQAAILRRLADSGGSGLVTAQAAADTAARKDGEAHRMRAALAALEEATHLP